MIMKKLENTESEVITYFKKLGFELVGSNKDRVFMRHSTLHMLQIWKRKDKFSIQIYDDSFANYNISYGAKPMKLEEYSSLKKHIRTAIIRAALLTTMVEWSTIRADESAYVRDGLGHISLSSLNPPHVYQDDDLILKLGAEKGEYDTITTFRYEFEPFGDITFIKHDPSCRAVIFPSEIRKFQDDILHWCAIPDNPLKRLREKSIFLFIDD